MSKFENLPIPDDWEVPRWDAECPVPCYKIQLVRWLAKHHGVTYDEDNVRMYTIVQFVNNRYYPAVCPNARNGGRHPSTWTVWEFVVSEEKKRRGGQKTLDLGV